MTMSKKILASIIAAITIASAIGIYESNPFGTTAFFLNEAGIKYHGHVTYDVNHIDGTHTIMQSDNTRTVAGINCAEQLLFQGLSPPGALITNGSSTTCGAIYLTSAHWNGFRFIGVMNQSSGHTITMNGSDTVATSKVGGTRTSAGHGIVFTANQGLPVNSTVAGTSTYNQITITSTAIPFTSVGAGGTNVCGAALLNSTSSTANVMFAENAFSCISLANTDTLTITWTITLS